ncbi:FadR/GntR family transcriptional regulator, partial [Bacillus timonensis]|uniref:FadR/GntR family transcriptional regulator n=1 Tax=Bacillus timonensis TaxID=1033734 RepID=UPI000288318C
MTAPNSKVYIEIVKQIRSIIQDDGLSAGDKIPSERELSDRLDVGRSSVREALRSLELLGLIETKRGEGTFLKDFGDHQLIHLLGTFIIQGDKTKNDLIETKHSLEKSCIELACHKMSDEILTEIEENLWIVEDPEE